VRVALFNQQQRAAFNLVSVAIDNSFTSSTLHIQPLIRALMSIIWATLALPRIDYHRGSLGMAVLHNNVKASSILHRAALHEFPCRFSKT